MARGRTQRRGILVSRRRYNELLLRAWDRREREVDRLRAEARQRGEDTVPGIPPYPMSGDCIAGRIPRPYQNGRQRTLRERRERNCAHAHISGGGLDYWGEAQDWDCSDCGAICPEPLARVIDTYEQVG